MDRERPRARAGKRHLLLPLIATTAVVAAVTTLSAPAGATGAPQSGTLSQLAPQHRVVPSPHPVSPRISQLAVPALPAGSRVVAAPMVTPTPSTGPVRLAATLDRPGTDGFSMVGVTWRRGSAPPGLLLEARAQSATGWGAWTVLDVDPGEGPAASEDRTGRVGSQPVWTGPAVGVQLAVYSRSGAAPADLRIALIDPGTSAYDSVAASATQDQGAGADATGAPGSFPAIPHIITRAQWGADDSLDSPCWQPRYGNQFKMVFVHHTAGTNTYTEAQSAGIVRGIFAYHTQVEGWCDIGYNFLIDKYGNIYEGRRGGIRAPVRGSHAGDYNLNTTGISLMGNFDTGYPTQAMKDALVSLIAWRMGTAYHGAYGTTVVAGKTFQRISGHRDAMSTDCPGQHVYDWLPTLRHLVDVRLGGWKSAIEKRWLSLGGASGRLGPVRTGERYELGGYHTTFDGGRAYYSTVWPKVLYNGAILHHYVANGGIHSGLGYPKTNVWVVQGTDGTAIRFAGGRMYWSPGTQSKILVNGVILDKYISLGAARGRLGFPTSRVITTQTGLLARFQHGQITFNSTTGQTTVTYY